MIPEPIFNNERIKQNLYWDIDLEKEFRGARRTGYGFVIDLLDGRPRLALYKMKRSYSTSTTLPQQPPPEMLLQAIYEQGGHVEQDNLYQINPAIRTWIEQNMLQR